MTVVGFDSLLVQAWNLILDKPFESIAIMGDGGTGKTTLMKLLYNKFVGTKDFETQIWVTVSSNLTLEKIQDDISRSMKLFDTKWVRKSSDEKSELIRSELAAKKSVLLCLDDVWHERILSGLGHDKIMGYWGSNCLLIFTTRSRKVADSASRVLFLDELLMEDALRLFWHKIGEDILSNRRISDMARIIVRKCEGLPIILCTVGRAMARRKTYEDWILALDEIERNDRELGIEIQPNYLLKFCFDSLPNHKVQSCLLYLSLFPEDFTIFRNDLIDFWICEQLLDDYDALNLGYNAVDALVEAGLLEQENHNVNMLDMIREFCLFLVFKSQIFKNAHLIEPTDSEKLQTVGWISPMGRFIRNLRNVPKILFTFLLDHNPFVMIRGGFSKFIKALTVLDLSKSGVEEVPPEISRLNSLQYLNLSHTWIEKLPIELELLTKLRCLNLEHDNQLRVIPRQIICGLSMLHVLKMFRCGYSVEELADNILSVTKMDIDPLLCLRRLKVLSITITCESALNKLCNNSKLVSCVQSLSLEVFWNSKLLNISCLATMNNLLTLEIHQAESLKGCSLEYSVLLTQTNFRRLQEVTIEKCSSLRELTWIILILNLKVLRLKSCEELTEVISTRLLDGIWKRVEDKELFAKLEVLVLESLPELRSIYLRPLSFPCLKRMEIIECYLLERLPLDSNSAKINEVTIEAEEDWWKDVKWDNDTDRATFVPCFKPLII